MLGKEEKCEKREGGGVRHKEKKEGGIRKGGEGREMMGHSAREAIPRKISFSLEKSK